MPPINFLIKPVSSSCNMKCSYCFYRDEAEIRQVASYGVMSEETLENIVAKGLEYADITCGFAFQGGEPTLAGLDFFKKLIDFQKKYNAKKVKIINSLQTNGLMIDDSWARVFHDNNFLIGLSLDGTKEVHNANRVDCQSEGSFKRVMKAAKIFDSYKVEYNILSVITAGSSRFAGSCYDFYKKNGFRYLQFIPCLDPLEHEHGAFPYSLKPGNLERFLKQLFDKWYKDFISGNYISIRYFDNLICLLNGQKPEACNMVGACQCNCVIEADGEMYPCDFYVLDKWKMGNIREKSIEKLLQSEVLKEFISSSLHIADECRTCRWYGLCRGGCRRECEPVSPGLPRNNCFCKDYKGFFDYSFERLSYAARIISKA